MNDNRKNLRIMFVVVLAFMFNKLLIRPHVLESEHPEFLNIFVLSFPNFCEAIIGGPNDIQY